MTYRHTQKPATNPSDMTLKEYLYNTWGEFVDFAESRVKSAYSTHEASRGTGGLYNASWSGTDTFAEAINLARSGWPEGTSRIKALSSVLIDKVTYLIEQPYIQYDTSGLDFDVALLLDSVPEHWYRMEHTLEEGTGKVVRVVFNGAVSAGITASTIMAKGAAVAALVECLEAAGNKVELVITQPWNFQGIGGRKVKFYSRVILKEAGQPLDIDRVAFALVNPASTRRLTFSVMESDDDYMQENNVGYGIPSSFPEGDIYVDRAFLGEPQWTNVQSTVEWVLKTLKEQGVTITSE